MSLLPLALLVLPSAAHADEDASDAPAEGAAAGAEAPAPAPPTPVSYALDPGRSSLYIIVRKDHDALGSGLAHDHVVVAQGWRGSVSWTPGDPSACAVEIHVPAASLLVDDPSWRKRAGLEGTLSDGQRGDVKEHMLSEDQLDAEHHPEIAFTSTGCSGSGDRVQVSGRLTIRGATRQVQLPMEVSASPDSFHAAGSLEIRATWFGFEPYSAAFGQIRNEDAMTLHVDVEGRPR